MIVVLTSSSYHTNVRSEQIESENSHSPKHHQTRACVCVWVGRRTWRGIKITGRFSRTTGRACRVIVHSARHFPFARPCTHTHTHRFAYTMCINAAKAIVIVALFVRDRAVTRRRAYIRISHWPVNDNGDGDRNESGSSEIVWRYVRLPSIKKIEFSFALSVRACRVFICSTTQ